MQTKYYYVPCPSCDNKLKFAVKNKEHLGKPRRLTCTTCWNEFEMTLSVSETPPGTTANQPAIDGTVDMTEEDLAIIGPLVEKFGNTLYEVVETDPTLCHIIEKLRAAGYDSLLIITATMGLSKKNGSPVREPVPLVKDGKIIQGAFSRGDGAWLKTFHINLGPEE